jgi:hypothetical protein
MGPSSLPDEGDPVTPVGNGNSVDGIVGTGGGLAGMATRLGD